MAMVTLTSPTYNPNLQRTLSLDSKNNNLRDASFSSYLNKGEEIFVRKLAEPSRNLNSVVNSREEQAGKKEEDEEIGVFGAERYFNGGIEDTSPRITKIDPKIYQYMKDGKVGPGHVRPKMQLGTPSLLSESSWNSQSALLKNSVVRNPPRRKTKKGNGKSFLTILGCKYCYCSDKESVDIDDEHVGELSFNRSANSVQVPGKAASREAPIKTSLDLVHVNGTVSTDPGLSKDNCFSFPTMKSEVGIHRNLPIKTKFQDFEEIPRKSLEVFGSPALQKRNKGLSLETRKLTMLSWNGTPRMDQEQEFSTISANHNDADSDASSDLFEIDSLTGKPNPFLARQTSDATSGCVTPTTGYAPSEASIEWSVVTASAADFSSVISDFEELRSSRAITSPVRNVSSNKNLKARANKDMIHKHKPSSLLGCKSQKAVRVAGDAHRKNQKPNYEPSQKPRFPAESKLTSFDPRNGIAALSIQRSHSPCASHLLYIQ
ncbi:protein PHYTOCHROME KINASE SUBSTRATE 1 [Carica papaya]|uniref:protein PHYTOCHROME KINASE SUBSTRATE 1 n=1 Tax=Carica papaya TaxID=3649 RepID=UPI000B8CC578|nr:protein PHYTOCHROME KINASE SUBSTRATE 1 [Carica papaya]